MTSSTPSDCPTCGAPLLPGDALCPFCGEVMVPVLPGRETAAAQVEPGFVAPPVSAPPPPAPRSTASIDAAGSEAPPWEARAEYGFWRALWLTWYDSVFRPVEFFRKLPPRGGIGPALGFTVLLTAFAILSNSYWATVQGALSGAQEGGVLLVVGGSIFVALLWLVFMVPIYLAMLFAMAGVLHLSFMMVGAGRRGFEATFRGIAYSSGPAGFAIFPFFGALLTLVWGTVVLFIAMREVQRTTNGRATLAFLLPLIAFTVFFIILAVILALVLASSNLATLQ